ncbi:hypothetical protein MMC17_008133 [Xylographa soralifera]|nr:hypothetical protein [Xylographa soralifera]
MKPSSTLAASLLSAGILCADAFAPMQNHQKFVPHRRSALPIAYPNAIYEEAQIFERAAYPEAYYEEREFYERDAGPEAFHKDADFHKRDAYPEAYYEELYLSERDAEPEQWFDEEFNIFGREAKKGQPPPITPNINIPPGEKIVKDTLKCNNKGGCSGAVEVQAQSP